MDQELLDSTIARNEVNQIINHNYFENCIVNGVSLLELDLSNKRFVDCSFRNCDFSMSKILGVRLSSCKFDNCKFVGVNWSQAEELSSLSLHECILDYCHFVNIKFILSNFINCRFKEVHFSESILSKALFNNCDFSGAVFNNCDLMQSDFRGSFNYIINPVENKVKGAKFSIGEVVGLLDGFGIKIE